MEHTALQLFLIGLGNLNFSDTDKNIYSVLVGSPWSLLVGGGGWVGKFGLEIGTLKFKINGGTFIFRDFWRPPQLILTPPPFINFSNFSRNYREVHKYIIDSWCSISVSSTTIYQKYRYRAKLIKLIRTILFSSLFFYILSPPPTYFNPLFINFSKSLKPPCLFWPPPPVYYEPESIHFAWEVWKRVWFSQ